MGEFGRSYLKSDCSTGTLHIWIILPGSYGKMADDTKTVRLLQITLVPSWIGKLGRTTLWRTSP
jgi:hypothetical protein